MIIVKTKISTKFDNIETEIKLHNKLKEALGNFTQKRSEQKTDFLLSGKIKRRELRSEMGDVNYYLLLIDVYDKFDNYKEVSSHPINLEVRKRLEEAGFIYETEIKYYSNDFFKKM